MGLESASSVAFPSVRGTGRSPRYVTRPVNVDACLVLTLAAAISLGGCGAQTDDGGGVYRLSTPSNETSQPRAIELPCVQARLDGFIDELQEQGIDFDYSGSSSPADLAATTDVVVSGSAVEIDDRARTGDNARAPGVALSIVVDDVLTGNGIAAGEAVEAIIQFNPSYWSAAELADSFEPNARGVFFLENVGTEDSPEWHPPLEGVWLSCDSGRARSMLADPVWSVATLNELESALVGSAT